MAEAAKSPQLEALLQHPSLWRGRSATPLETFPTGFAELDRALPGGGWPRRGLVEILTPGAGCGELRLWTPLLARLTQQHDSRWCAFVSPPFEPYVPAWQARGVRSDRLLVVRGEQGLWAMEQSLLSGACGVVFGWLARATMRELRRLALATGKGASLGVIIRPLRAAQEHSAAVLRIVIETMGSGLRLHLIKGRGVRPACIEIVP